MRASAHQALMRLLKSGQEMRSPEARSSLTPRDVQAIRRQMFQVRQPRGSREAATACEGLFLEQRFCGPYRA